MMNGKQGARSYVDLDPTFEWSRGEETDMLRVYLPGFKREYIKVQVDAYGNLRTTGELPQEDNRWVRFWKDFRIPANCNVNTIRAKFEDETLIITFPREIVRAKPTSEPPSQQLPPPSKPAPAPAKPAPAPAKPVPAPAKPAPAPAKPVPAPAKPAPAPAKPVPAPAKPAPALPKPAPAVPEVPKPAADQASVPGSINRPASSKLREMLRAKDEDKKVDDKPKVTTPAPTPAGPALVTDKKENESKKEDHQKPFDEKVTEKQPVTEATGAPGGNAIAYPAKEPAQTSDQVMTTTGLRSQQRGLLLNVAAALVVLLGMAIYLSFRLRKITDHGGDHHGAGKKL